MKNKRLIGILFMVAFLLLIPFIAMQFTNEVAWTAFDFLVAGILLLITGLICEWVLRKVNNNNYRIVFCGIIILLLLLTWAELAVGIFGSPLAGS